tara:strand:- start:17919 stop:19451 length:1533 start_codon:yes stop_codon:yes gene_type:complete
MTRLAHLTILPIFNDEAIYISWAKMIKEDIHNIWFPVQIESKKPLLMCLIALFLKIFEDPLWAARSVSVVAGFFSLIGIYLIGLRLHSVNVGCISAFLYTVSPYFLFYDRMAHQDSLLNCFFIWMLLLSLIIFQQGEKIKVRCFGTLGFIIGLSLLAKSTAILFVFLPLMLKFIFLKKSAFIPWNSLLQSYLLGLLIAALPYIHLFLLTSTKFSIKSILIPTQTSLAQSSIADILFEIPKNIFFHFGDPVSYFITYLTLPVLFLAGIFFIFQFIAFNKNYFILFLFFFIPFISILGIGGGGFSRYYLFCGTPILLWAALALYYGIDYIKKLVPEKSLYLTITPILIIVLYPAIAFDSKLLTKPEEVSFVGRDYDQYINNEFSGYGIPEALDYFKKVSSDKKITIFTTSNWGNPADSVHVYLSDYPNITVYTAFWVFEHVLLPSNASKIVAKNKYKKNFEFHLNSLSDVYFICNSRDFERKIFLNKNKGFQLVKSLRKPNSTIFIDIYKHI